MCQIEDSSILLGKTKITNNINRNYNIIQYYKLYVNQIIRSYRRRY